MADDSRVHGSASPSPISMQDMASVLEEFLRRKSVLEGLPGHEYSRLNSLYEAINTEVPDVDRAKSGGSGT